MSTCTDLWMHVSPLFTRISNLILYQIVIKLEKSWDKLAKDKYICLVKIFILDIQGTNLDFFSFEKLLYYKLIHKAEVHLGNIKLWLLHNFWQRYINFYVLFSRDCWQHLYTNCFHQRVLKETLYWWTMLMAKERKYWCLMVYSKYKMFILLFFFIWQQRFLVSDLPSLDLDYIKFFL